MINTLMKQTNERIEQMLIHDKQHAPKELCSLIKSEIYEILQNYLILNNIDIKLDIAKDSYIFTLSASAKRLKNINFLS